MTAGPEGKISSSRRTLDYYNLLINHSEIYRALKQFADITYHKKFLELFGTPFAEFVHFNWWKVAMQQTYFFKNSDIEYLRGLSAFTVRANICKIGRLSTKYEAAGKVRVFAIGDYWTQWCLQPFHNYIFDILKRIPQDATFNQDLSLDTFVRNNYGAKFWSLDLKSATDMIPKELYIPLITNLIGAKAALMWSKIMDRPFRVPKEIESNLDPKDVEDRNIRNKHLYVSYTRGQPMGFLSSWAVLALLHHAIVHFAYSLAYPDSKCPAHMYRVLGDDVAIADEKLAESYMNVCTQLGIIFSVPKSYLGTTVVNFASQVISNRGENFSPISLKEVMQAKTIDRKAEFVYRLAKIQFIPDGFNNLFRAFFIRDSWKHETPSLSKGIFSRYGKRAYRVLLQPNGRNKLTLLNYALSFTSLQNFVRIPEVKVSVSVKALSGYFYNPRAPYPDLELFAHQFIHKLDKYLDTKVDEFIASVERLSKIRPWPSNPKGPEDESWRNMSNALIAPRYTDHMPEEPKNHFELNDHYRSLVDKVRKDTIEAGYTETGFDPALYITERLKLISNLPVLFNRFSEKEVIAAYKEVRKEENLYFQNLHSMHERVCSRRILSSFIVDDTLLTSLANLGRTFKVKSALLRARKFRVKKGKPTGVLVSGETLFPQRK
jgi:hypothetical protein